MKVSTIEVQPISAFLADVGVFAGRAVIKAGVADGC